MWLIGRQLQADHFFYRSGWETIWYLPLFFCSALNNMYFNLMNIAGTWVAIVVLVLRPETVLNFSTRVLYGHWLLNWSVVLKSLGCCPGCPCSSCIIDGWLNYVDSLHFCALTTEDRISVNAIDMILIAELYWFQKLLDGQNLKNVNSFQKVL